MVWTSDNRGWRLALLIEGHNRLPTAIATNPAIAGTIRAAGADYLLAVKANQPTGAPPGQPYPYFG